MESLLFMHCRKYYRIGDRKDSVSLRLYGQKLSSPYAAISAMLDTKGRAFVLIPVVYKERPNNLRFFKKWSVTIERADIQP